MSQIVNAIGLACPQPVILTKKALELNDEVTVTVDNRTAVENITRLAQSSSCSVDVAEEAGGIFRISLRKAPGAPVVDPGTSCADESGRAAGPTVFLFTSDEMGGGSSELGLLLMKAFIHTATELDVPPHTMIFYNGGVKLTAEGADTVADLKALESKGVRMLVCGTCINYYGLTGKIAAGTVSNMYDILGTLNVAGRIIRP